MNLVDSSAWLEYFADSENAQHFSSAIENSENLLVSVINIYEVYKKITHERNENLALQAVALMQQAQIIPATSEIALLAAKASIQYKIPMADSIIFATAQLHNATVWTQDADFENLPNVKYFKKG